MLELEITQAGTDMESVAADLESEFGWIAGYELPTDGIAIIEHIGGPNDLVLTQTLELMETLDRYGVDLDDMTIDCSVIEQ